MDLTVHRSSNKISGRADKGLAPLHEPPPRAPAGMGIAAMAPRCAARRSRAGGARPGPAPAASLGLGRRAPAAAWAWGGRGAEGAGRGGARSASAGAEADALTLDALERLQDENALLRLKVQQLEAYVGRLLEQNRSLNLTGAASRREAFDRHVADALALLPALDRLAASPAEAEGAGGGSGSVNVLDVGSGAGLPGLVLAIARPAWRVTLLDALRKRCTFVEDVAAEVGVGNVEVLWSRAEDAGRAAGRREAYDLVTARAVAPLPVLAELCLPLVRPGGWLVAAKGPEDSAAAEVAAARHAIEALGGGRDVRVEAVDAFSSDGQSRMTAVLVPKERATGEKFPRRAGIPNKRPLLR